MHKQDSTEYTSKQVGAAFKSLYTRCIRLPSLHQPSPTADGMEAASQNAEQPSPNPQLNVHDLYLRNGARVLSEYIICGAHPAGMPVRTGAPGHSQSLK